MGASGEKNNIIIYERKLYKMPKKNKGDKKDKNPLENIDESSGKSTQKSSVDRIVVIISMIIGIFGIIGGIFTVITNIVVPISNNTNDIKHLEASLVTMKQSLNDIDNNLTKLSEFVYTNRNSEYTRSDENAIPIKFLDNYTLQIELADREEFLIAPKWQNLKESVAVGLKNNSLEYTAEDLQNKSIITMYEEGNSEIYFYGKFNQNNHWDGKCILNVYKSNELITVFEGIYNDGNLYSYHRVSNDDEKEWVVTERKLQKDEKGKEYKSGETWYYVKTQYFPKQINQEDFNESDIVGYESFVEDMDEELVKYYNGNTSNGLYNDDTGNAYLVTYFRNGEIEGADKNLIKTFYQGNFVAGNFEDDTFNAWYITREVDTTYMFYKGCFSRGEPDRKNKKKEEFENYLQHDRIAEILEEKGFEEYGSDFFVEY